MWSVNREGQCEESLKRNRDQARGKSGLRQDLTRRSLRILYGPASDNRSQTPTLQTRVIAHPVTGFDRLARFRASLFQ